MFHLLALVADSSLDLTGCDSFEISGKIGTDKTDGAKYGPE